MRPSCVLQPVVPGSKPPWCSACSSRGGLHTHVQGKAKGCVGLTPCCRCPWEGQAHTRTLTGGFQHPCGGFLQEQPVGIPYVRLGESPGGIGDCGSVFWSLWRARPSSDAPGASSVPSRLVLAGLLGSDAPERRGEPSGHAVAPCPGTQHHTGAGGGQDWPQRCRAGQLARCGLRRRFQRSGNQAP